MADRHFLVVGGTRGIGLELTKLLLTEPDCRVTVVGRSISTELEGERLAQFPVDVSDNQHWPACIDEVVAIHGKLSTVVFMQRNREGVDLEHELAVALDATQRAIEHIVAHRHFAEASQSSSIVIISSVADSCVAPEQSLGYHLGKAGLSHMVRYYALKLGPLGIRVNAVSPCVVAKQRAQAYYAANPWLVERFERFIPLGRMGRPEDIANAVMFLASRNAAYITGQNILVDGGLTLRSHESLIREFPSGE